jgi:cytosine/adenosine deaminase-related metal-dependent hydrolase
MSSLLVRNLRAIVTCDDGDSVLNSADLYAEDGVIRALGPDLPQRADTVLDGTGMLCYPGLVNAHHHLYQIFLAQSAPGAEPGAFRLAHGALRDLEGIKRGHRPPLHSMVGMRRADEKRLHHRASTTTTSFPKNGGDLIGAQFEAAEALGVRMHASRAAAWT